MPENYALLFESAIYGLEQSVGNHRFYCGTINRLLFYWSFLRQFFFSLWLLFMDDVAIFLAIRKFNGPINLEIKCSRAFLVIKALGNTGPCSNNIFLNFRLNSLWRFHGKMLILLIW